MTRPCGYFDGHSREECGEPAAYLYVSPEATVARARCQEHAQAEVAWMARYMARDDVPEAEREYLRGWRLVPVGDPWPGPAGMYYTPRHVVDPAAGSGAFLVDLTANPPWAGRQ